MHWLSVLSILAAATSLGLASPLKPRWDDMIVKHSLDTIPPKWEYHGHPPAGTTIDLRSGRTARPPWSTRSTRYGAHLSKEEVAELVVPHPDSNCHPRRKLSETFEVPLAQINALLGTSYQVYRHAETEETIFRTTRYALPAAPHGHVQAVAPTTYFGSPRALRRLSRLAPDRPRLIYGDLELQNPLATLGIEAPVPSSCSNTITPTCLRHLYKTASHSDLTKFMTLFRANAKAATFPVEKVNGGMNNESQPGGEADLDIQYAGALIYPTPSIFYSTRGSPPFRTDDATPTNTNEPYLEWLEFILNQTTISQTISTSYGDDEQTVPPEYGKCVCDLFAQLGARGVSVLFATGDYGVGEGDCLTNIGTKVMQISPAFPASCPFVTAVGGTTGVNPEVAAKFSGGAFSNYFGRPAYQNGAVSTYLEKIGSKNRGLYNHSGRGYPDISARATNFQVVYGGEVVSGDGTSCAAPTAASVISLLNDFLISKGKRSLGFLNPLLYSKAVTGFNDITSGPNSGCGTAGFSAMEGWDPVTGLGTPNFLELQRLVK